MWKIGPECAAQQAKCASASVMNCGVLSACGPSIPVRCAGSIRAAVSGGWRRVAQKRGGINSAKATMPITSIAVRQS
jgi:hypothetical protein